MPSQNTQLMQTTPLPHQRSWQLVYFGIKYSISYAVSAKHATVGIFTIEKNSRGSLRHYILFSLRDITVYRLI